VRLDATQWLTMLGLILVGLLPIATMGIMLGHLVTVDSLVPRSAASTSLLSLLGGAFGPLATTGTLLTVVKLLPPTGSSKRARPPWWKRLATEAWIVIAVWTVVLGRITALAYRRVTARV